MIKMRRNEFYLLVYVLITSTAFLVGLDMQKLAWFSLVVGAILFVHFKLTTKKPGDAGFGED